MGANRAFGNMEPAETLYRALLALPQAGLKPLRVSNLWQSPAWPPGRGAADYLNAVVLADPGTVAATEVLERLHRIEADHGRVRDRADRWASRSLDLDLIDQNGLVLAGTGPAAQGLVLPHPRARDRDFVLAPLLEVAPGWRHPVTGEAGCDLLAGVRAGLAAGGEARPLVDGRGDWPSPGAVA